MRWDHPWGECSYQTGRNYIAVAASRSRMPSSPSRWTLIIMDCNIVSIALRENLHPCVTMTVLTQPNEDKNFSSPRKGVVSEDPPQSLYNTTPESWKVHLWWNKFSSLIGLCNSCSSLGCLFPPSWGCTVLF